jgi:hypothetical protein
MSSIISYCLAQLQTTTDIKRKVFPAWRALTIAIGRLRNRWPIPTNFSM